MFLVTKWLSFLVMNILLTKWTNACAGGTIQLSSTAGVVMGHDEATVSFTFKAFDNESLEKARSDCAKVTAETLATVRAIGLPSRNITSSSIRSAKIRLPTLSPVFVTN